MYTSKNKTNCCLDDTGQFYFSLKAFLSLYLWCFTKIKHNQILVKNNDVIFKWIPAWKKVKVLILSYSSYKIWRNLLLYARGKRIYSDTGPKIRGCNLPAYVSASCNLAMYRDCLCLLLCVRGSLWWDCMNKSNRTSTLPPLAVN